MTGNTSRSVLVWDVPTRLFHWLIVSCIAVSWWSAETRLMNVHRYSGYVLLGALIFRIYWGVVGSATSRFAQFVRGPRAIAAYVRNPAAHSGAGHNPLGGWSVITMLALLATQVLLGLFVTDIDGLESGPLSHLVSFETGRALAESHELVFDVLLAFIALHIAALLFYLLVRRTNLIKAMVTGRRSASELSDQLELAPLSRMWIRVGAGVAIAVLVVWLVAKD